MQSSLIRETSSLPELDQLFAGAAREDRALVLEHEALGIVRSLGIPVPDHVFIRADEDLVAASERAWESLWSSQVVVKVVSPEIAHKTELGGVKTVPKRPAEIFRAIAGMQSKMKRFDIRGFLVSELIEHDASPGGEILVNLRWNSEFGPVVTVGLGGLSAEVLGRALRPGTEIAVLAPSLTPPERVPAVLQGKAFASLISGGVRNGLARLPVEELAHVVSRLLDFATKNVPEPFGEIEINPLVLGPHGPVALDALIRPGSRQPESVPRPIEKIHRLLRPRSIAVVGVSRSLNPGRTIVRNLLRDGFDPDAIWIVKEGCEEIDGCRCVDAIESIPERVDLIVLSIGADAVLDAMNRIVEGRKAESVIVIPGGIGEREGSGRLERMIRNTIERSRSTDWGGPVVNGGNSLGVRSIPGRYDTTFLPSYKVAPASSPGDAIAIVSQSGAFAVSLGSRLAPISPRTIVSIGNQIDLTLGDYMTAMADDPSIDLFAFYVEGFRPGDGRRWLEAAARAIDLGKTIILYRGGRTPEGRRATASHTAALAGDAVVTRELARTAGVVVADTLDAFEDFIRTFWQLRDRATAGIRLGAISNAGFECVAMADNPGPFRLVQLSEGTVDRIRHLFRENRLDSIMNVGNPLDVNPLLGDQSFADAARAILADPGIDLAAIGCVPLTGALQTLPTGSDHQENIDSEDSVVAKLVRLWQQTDKPWVAIVDAGELYDEMAGRLADAGIPTFRRADRALHVLGTWAEWKLR